MYIEREIEQTIDSMLRQGKVVLVTGSRQVGKTTVLRQHLGGRFNYVSMENPWDYLLAKEDALGTLSIGVRCPNCKTQISIGTPIIPTTLSHISNAMFAIL